MTDSRILPNRTADSPTPHQCQDPHPNRQLYASWGEVGITSIEGGDDTINETLGWTVTPGDFVVVEVSGLAGATITGAIGDTASATQYPMTAAVNFNSAPQPISLFCLANSPAITSININLEYSSGTETSIIVAEYSGLSPTAAPVATAVTNEQAYVYSSTWTTSTSYSVPSGALVLSGCDSTVNGAVWSAGTGWTVVDQENGYLPAMVLQESIAPAAGSMTGTGTYTLNYQYFDSFIVAFK